MIMTMENTCDEAGLLAMARRGSLDAFNQLVLHHQDDAWNLAYHLLWDETGADDAVQCAVLALYRKLWRMDKGSIRLYLLQLVTAECQKGLKANGRPHSRTTLRGAEAEAASRLAGLPAAERIVLVLSEMEGLNCQEIAEVTGMPAPVVKQRLSRALATSC